MKTFLFISCLILVIIAGLMPSTQAQRFEDVAPKSLPTLEESQVAFKRSLGDSTASDVVLVDSLRTLIFLTTPKKLNTLRPTADSPLLIEIGTFLDKVNLQRVARDYIGRPISLQSIEKLRGDVVLAFRKQGRALVRVYTPPQDITDGVLQVIVQEAKLEKLIVNEAKYFPEEKISSKIRTRIGETIVTREMMKDLRWINQNPFRRYDIVYSKGDQAGTTRVELRGKDRFPWRFYTGFEDTGNALVDDNRWLAGFHWGNAWNLEHLLSYQFSMANDPNRFSTHAGIYTIPLPWRHTFTLLGSFGENNPDISPLNIKGRSWQTSARYRVPLYASENFEHNLTLGYDFKQTNTDITARGGTRVNEQRTEISQFPITYDASLKDNWGRTQLTAGVVLSPGDMTHGNKDRIHSGVRPGASANYIYETLALVRDQKLPYDFSAQLRAQFQHSHSRLLGSEQFGLGGFNTVRGYDEREVNGDSGYFLSAELRLPPFSPAKLLAFEKGNDRLQFHLFTDYGTVFRHAAALDKPADRHTTIASAGAGFRYILSPYISLRFDYGWQLMDSGFNQRNDARMHIGAIISY